jgi:hypothetical protein
MTAALGVLAALATLACALLLVRLHLLPTGYSARRDRIADYGVGRFSGHYVAAAIAIGVAALAAAIGLAHEHERWYVVVLLAAFGASRLVAPWFPPDLEGERPSRPGRIHLWLAAFAYATIAAAAGLSDRAPWLGWAAAVCLAVTLLSLRGGALRDRTGQIERLGLLAVLAWLLVVAVELSA